MTPAALPPLPLLRLAAVLLGVACCCWLSGISVGAAAGLACEGSGMCSLGKVKPFMGDVYPSPSLQAALDARSFNKEVIIGVFMRGSESQLLQWHSNLEQLGFEHTMALAMEAKDCQRLSQFRTDIGCVYFTTPMDHHHLTGVMLLWHWRYRLLARIVHKGYNAMSCDFDVLWFDDPYKFFKQPPFKDIQLLGQCENEWWDDCTNLNGGFIYAQNAKADGPAVFVIGDVVYRQLRWLEDNMEWLVTNHKHPPNAQVCMHMDQAVLNEAFPSVLWGRPIFFTSFDACQSREVARTPEFRAKIDKMEQDILMSPYRNPDFRKRLDFQVAADSEIAKKAGSKDLYINTYNMRVPNARGEWPERFGGKFWPPSPGNLTRTFLKELSDDCPSCPPWPDVEDPAQADRANATLELFTFMPPWLFVNWLNRGRYGYWNTQPPQQVLGHLHYIPDTERGLGKVFLQVHLGFLNYTLVDRLFRADHNFHPYLNPTVADPPIKPPLTPIKVLALDPSVDLSAIKSEGELRWLLVGLAQLALLSKRTVVWPSIPCLKMPWTFKENKTSTTLPFRFFHHRFMLYGSDPERDPAGAKCAYVFLAHGTCFLHGIHALAEVEFDHWRKAHGLSATPAATERVLKAQPASSRLNTIGAGGYRGGGVRGLLKDGETTATIAAVIADGGSSALGAQEQPQLSTATSAGASGGSSSRSRVHGDGGGAARRRLAQEGKGSGGSSSGGGGGGDGKAPGADVRPAPLAGGLLSRAFELDVRQVKAVLAGKEKEQVLYVGTPVLLWYSNEVVDQQAQEAFQKAANGCPVTALSPDMRRLKEVPEGEGFIEPLPAVPLGMVNVDGSVGPRPEKAAWAHGRQAGGPPPAASSSTK